MGSRLKSRPDGSSGSVSACDGDNTADVSVLPQRAPAGDSASHLGASGVARWSLPPCHVPAAPAAAAKTRSRDRAPSRVSPAGPPTGVGSGYRGGRREGAAVSQSARSFPTPGLGFLLSVHLPLRGAERSVPYVDSRRSTF